MPATQATPTTPAKIAEIIDHAGLLGLRGTELDGEVYDLTRDNASRAVAANEGSYEELHSDAEELASQINSKGLDEQIAFICSELGPFGTEQLLDALGS